MLINPPEDIKRALHKQKTAEQERPFIRRHALTSIVTGVVLIPITIITLGFGGFLYLVFFYWAYQAYLGQQVEIPVVSDWIRQLGWLTDAAFPE